MYKYISYIDVTNFDLKFAKYLNNDCASSTRTVADSAGEVNEITSLVFGAENLTHISYYHDGDDDLKFARCVDDVCTPPDSQIDVAQSFTPSASQRIVKIELYLKKIGSPANATVRLVRDSSGSPSTNPADVLTAGTLNAAAVGTSYAWQTVVLTQKPTLSSGTRYWIVVDTSLDNADYLLQGGDAAAGYAGGSAKRSADWTLGGWISIGADLDFRV